MKLLHTSKTVYKYFLLFNQPICGNYDYATLVRKYNVSQYLHIVLTNH